MKVTTNFGHKFVITILMWGANLLCRGCTGKVIDWNSTLHDLQLCFGVKEFLVCFNLTPLVLYFVL